MPDGEVSGTINVEVIYKEAGGAGIASGAPTSGMGGMGAASGSEAASETKKKASQMFDITKYLKVVAGALTIGAVIKQSKIIGTVMGTITQLLGAMIDVFLMPFIPVLIPLMKAMAGVVKWLMIFMEDPIQALKDAFWAAVHLSKDIISGIFTGWGEFSLKDFFGNIDFTGIAETALKMGVGVIGIAGLFTAITGAQALSQLFGKGVLMTATYIASKLFGMGTAVLGAAMETFLGLGTSVLPMKRLLPILGVGGLIVGLIAAEHFLNKGDDDGSETNTVLSDNWSPSEENMRAPVSSTLYQSSEASVAAATSSLGSSIFSANPSNVFEPTTSSIIPNFNITVIDGNNSPDAAYVEERRLEQMRYRERYSTEME
jgi:hypothetical protein